MAQATRTTLGNNANESKSEAALVRARELTAAFRANFSTVILGTTSADGEPDASVAPAVLGEDMAFYTYVSTLALHTRNLLDSRRASVLLIEDEGQSAQLLARKRLTFRCSAALVARTDSRFFSTMTALKQKFGPVMEQLESMTDFHLLRLLPESGRLVIGFGQAYEVDPRDWSQLSHVGGSGHGNTAIRKEDA